MCFYLEKNERCKIQFLRVRHIEIVGWFWKIPRRQRSHGQPSMEHRWFEGWLGELGFFLRSFPILRWFRLRWILVRQLEERWFRRVLISRWRQIWGWWRSNRSWWWLIGWSRGEQPRCWFSFVEPNRWIEVLQGQQWRCNKLLTEKIVFSSH